MREKRILNNRPTTVEYLPPPYISWSKITILSFGTYSEMETYKYGLCTKDASYSKRSTLSVLRQSVWRTWIYRLRCSASGLVGRVRTDFARFSLIFSHDWLDPECREEALHYEAYVISNTTLYIRVPFDLFGLPRNERKRNYNISSVQICLSL